MANRIHSKTKMASYKTKSEFNEYSHNIVEFSYTDTLDRAKVDRLTGVFYASPVLIAGHHPKDCRVVGIYDCGNRKGVMAFAYAEPIEG